MNGHEAIPAKYDDGGNCLYCGESGRCPGYHTRQEVVDYDNFNCEYLEKKEGKILKATRHHGPCSCDCGYNIQPGNHFVILQGEFYIAGHESINGLERANEMPARDYSKITTRKQVEQKPLSDLPIFNNDVCAEQMQLVF
jgi:hypothetical protein